MAVYRLVCANRALLKQCPIGVLVSAIQHPPLAYLDFEVPENEVDRLEQWCLENHVDYATPGFNRSDIGLLAMDMDSTLITIECIDEIADFIGAKGKVAAITEASMQGQIKFTDALYQRVALLAGLPVETLEAVYSQRLELSPGAESMLAGFKAAGTYTLLVSGGFKFFTDRLKAQLGLDEAHANVLEVSEGRLTGRIVGDVLDGAAKAKHVQRVRTALQSQVSRGKRAIAVGDGSNDRLMFAEVDAGVAYHAKPVLEAIATHHIRHGGLDTLLAFFP